MPKGGSRRSSRQADFEDEFEPAMASPRGGGGSILHMTEGLIPIFTGQDKTYPAARWIQDVEDNAEVFGWTPVQTLLMARRSLSGTAALWVRAERTFKSWEEVKGGIAKEFPDSIDMKTIHEMMSKRIKKTGESCVDYMLVMKELGRRGKMPDYVAIKYIVQGIQDDEINKVMLYGVSSYIDLKEKLRIYEQLKEKMAASKNYQRQQRPHGVDDRRDRRFSRCFSCGEMKHASADCPHKDKGLKCFKCNQFGHIAPNCSTTTTTSQQSRAGNNARFGVNTAANGEAGSTAKWRKHDVDGAGVKRSYFSRMMNGTSDCTTHGGEVGSTAANMAADDVLTTVKSEEVFCVNKPKDDIKKPVKQIEVLGISVKALIDSGSDINLISVQCYTELHAPEFEKCGISLSGLGEGKVKCLGRIQLNIEIDGQDYDDVRFYIVPRDAMPYSMIIGQEFLQRCVVIMERNMVRLKPASSWVYEICVSDSFVVGHEVSGGVQRQVNDMVESYKPNKTKEAPIKLKILLKDDIPVVQRPRRLAPIEQEKVDHQVAQWLDEGIIRVSYSEYACPIVLVRKKDGELRVCVDYRPLNKKIIKDEYPLPIVEDHIDKLVGAKVFSTLDVKNGYFHLSVEESSIGYTAFVTQTGHYEFLKAPFGLSICPKVFTRFITIIFRDLIARGVVIIFIDDLIIPALSEEDAVIRLSEVLDVASQYGLQINWKKAQLVQRRVEYLGHVIENGEVRPTQEKTDAVVRFPVPSNTKQLHSFLGLTSYFRKYIKDYASIAKPLSDLLKKDNIFQFDDQCRHASQELKMRLACHPVLKIFNPNLETELHTDASTIAYSAILLQRSMEDGQLHPVFYLSRKTSPAESKYTSYELEALAIIEGIKKFRCYLFGKNFKILTDCKAFQMTFNKKELAMSTRVARWILMLQEYDFTIEHRSGSQMRHVDALSRNPYVAVLSSNRNLHDKIRNAQVADEGLKAIIEILNRNMTYEDYYLRNNLLYKGTQDHLVIPCTIEKDIIKKAHENGHFAKKKMLQLIDRDYYIPNLEKKIEDYLITCIPCLLAERKRGKAEGFLNPIEKEETPFHTLHLDHIGPMTETKKLYNHLLTVVDAFTKFVWLFPVKSTTTAETINKLEIHQQCFGNPSRIITDRGTAFTSLQFEEYCKEENIQQIKITTGVPRANGQVERIHRVIISVLTKLCIESPTQWYKYVSQVQRCINSTYQRSINTTPFELLLGTKMRMREDVEIYHLLEQETRDNFMLTREENRKQAKEQIFKIQEENRRTYNKKRKESKKYRTGDLVAIKRTQFGVGMKLKPKFLGPYAIVRATGKDRYQVEKVDVSTEGPRMTTTASDHMKPWPMVSTSGLL